VLRSRSLRERAPRAREQRKDKDKEKKFSNPIQPRRKKPKETRESEGEREREAEEKEKRKLNSPSSRPTQKSPKPSVPVPPRVGRPPVGRSSNPSVCRTSLRERSGVGDEGEGSAEDEDREEGFVGGSEHCLLLLLFGKSW